MIDVKTTERITQPVEPQLKNQPVHQILLGTTWHSRYLPSKHSFSYPYRYWGLNLQQLAITEGIMLADAETDQAAQGGINSLINSILKRRVFNKLFTDEGFAIHSFAYDDYVDTRKLDASNEENLQYLKNKTQHKAHSKIKAQRWLITIQQEFARLTGSVPAGEILALVVSRNLGFYFSPVNFYLGFDETGNASHLLAEVSNTPWNKSHYYGFLLDDYQNGETCTFSHHKNFHVSPFNPLDQIYNWRVKVAPSKKQQGCTDLKLSIHVSDDRGKVFAAGVNMQAQRLTMDKVQQTILSNPVMNYSSMARIYWHALILYGRKKVAYIDYNQQLKNSNQAATFTKTSHKPINQTCNQPSFQQQGVDKMNTAMPTSTMTIASHQPTERNILTSLDKLVDNPILKPLSRGINNNVNQLSKRLLYKLLANFQYGHITLIETFANNSKSKLKKFGDATVLSDLKSLKAGEVAGTHPLAITVKIHNPAFYQKIIIGGSIALADSYIDGDWEVDDLTALIRLGARNMDAFNKLESKFSRLTKTIERNKHRLRHNTVSNSKSNILAHYDLGNDMYKTFLDDSMMYSAAIYKTPDMALADAQQLKLKTLCEQLELSCDDKVIEIGTGWGGFAIYAATHYGCHVTTTTISDAQYEEATRRVEQAGLTDKITLLKQDYRELTGSYDKLISIEMVEAVGHEYLPIFFRKCNELLKDNGIMSLQAITFNDQGYEEYLTSVDFIQSHIFPGGCLLSNQEIIKQFTNQTDMVVKSLIDYGYDYAYTLRDWRHTFMQHLDLIRQMGYGNAFIRLWHFYFAYCEGGFLERTIGVVQVKAVKREHR